MERQSSQRARSFPLGESRVPVMEWAARARAVHWVLTGLAILVVDYLTGPFIQFPILFVVPVAIATVANGVVAGSAVAAVLPLLRLSFFLHWDLPSSWLVEWVDTAVDIVILIGFAALIRLIVLQRSQIRVLEGMLPICSFCKRIRDEGGNWRQLEMFISERSDALFSHTFCQQCAKTHFPEAAE